MDAHALDFASVKGPRRLPIIGNMHQLNPRRFHAILEDWCRTFGTPYRFSVAHRHVLVISEPAAIIEVLRRRPEDFRRADWIEPVFKEIGAHGVFSAEGDAWRRQRRLVTPSFVPAHLKNYFPSLMRVAQRLRQRWLDAARLGRPIELQGDLMRFTVDVTAGLAFGADVNTIESDTDPIQEHLNSVFTEINRRGGIPFPYWRYFRLPRDRALDRHLSAQAPDIWRRIADESDAILGDAPGMTQVDQAGQLGFIDACISETMRLRPVAPVSALTARREVVLEGVRVPPGTEVITLTRIAATKAERFPSPLVFRPERWLEDDANRDAIKRSMFPFGGGSRYCPGRYLALLEMKMVMSMLARNFERPDVRSVSGSERSEVFNFTMMPSPLAMRLLPRVAAQASG